MLNKKRIKQLSVASAVILVLYTLIGFIAIPLIITNIVPAQVPKFINGELTIEHASFNPFSFRLTIDGINLKGPDTITVFSLKHLDINFQTSAVLTGRIGFKQIVVDTPYIYGCIFEDKSLNFLKLVKPAEKTAEKEIETDVASGPITLPPLDIALLTVKGGNIKFTDKTLNAPFSREIKDLGFSIESFSTRPESHNRSRFVMSESNMQIEWNGNLQFNPLSSRGTVTITKFQPSAFSPYYQKFLNSKLASCDIGATVNYVFDPLAAEPAIKIENTSFTVDAVALRGITGEKPFKSLKTIRVDGIAIDIIKGQAQVKSIIAEGGELHVSRNKDGAIDLIGFLVPPKAESPEKPAKHAEPDKQEAPETQEKPASPAHAMHTQSARENLEGSPAQLEAAPVEPARPPELAERRRDKQEEQEEQAKPDIQAPTITDAITATLAYIEKAQSLPWIALINHFGIHNQRITATDAVPSTPLNFGLTVKALDIYNITNKESESAKLNLDIAIDSGGTINVDATAQLKPTQAEVKYSLDNIDFTIASPYIKAINGVTIKSGLFNTSGQLKVTLSPETQDPEVNSVVNLSVDKFALQHNLYDEAQTFVSWDKFAITKFKALYPELKFTIKEIGLHKPLVSTDLDETGTISLLYLIPKANTKEEDEEKTSQPKAKHIKEAAEVEQTVKTQSQPPKLPVYFFLEQFIIEDGSVSFSDKKIAPGFGAHFTNMNLAVKGVSSNLKNAVITEFDGKGLDGGIFNVSAQIVPNPAHPKLNLKLLTNTIALPEFTPYSKRFVGYQVDNGKLNIKQNYTIDGNDLKGSITTNIDTIELGEFHKGDDVISLPLNFVLSLLKDNNNQINFPKVKLSGKLDDPELNIGSLIWSTVSNMFINIATSPFSFLASSMGHGDVDLSSTNFAAGKTELAQKEKDKLAILADILQKRPSLELQIHPQVNPSIDTRKMYQLAFDKLYHDTREKLRSRISTIEGKDAVDEAKVIDYLYNKIQAKYARRDKDNSSITLLYDDIYDDKPKKEPTFEEKKEEVMEHVKVPEELLYALAQKRGASIRDYLLESKQLDSDRVKVVKPNFEDIKYKGTGAFFELN